MQHLGKKMGGSQLGTNLKFFHHLAEIGQVLVRIGASYTKMDQITFFYRHGFPPFIWSMIMKHFIKKTKNNHGDLIHNFDLKIKLAEKEWQSHKIIHFGNRIEDILKMIKRR
jgi:hypothetical protein